jgi:hypothetical protein
MVSGNMKMLQTLQDSQTICLTNSAFGLTFIKFFFYNDRCGVKDIVGKGTTARKKRYALQGKSHDF